jgi:hypothetical protein
MTSVEMLRRVLIFGIVATAYAAADHAQAQMHPTVTHFEALGTARAIWLDVLNLVKMRAFVVQSDLDIKKDSPSDHARL